MSTEHNKDLARSFFAAQDRLKGGPDPALCGSAYAAQIGGLPLMDLTGHQQFAAAFYAGFPDVHHTVEETVAEGNTVAVRFRLDGTHTGSFMGLPATGKPIHVSAVVIMDVADGRVVALRGVFDQALLMQQLGVGV